MLIKNPTKSTKNYLKTFIKFDPNSETNFRWARNRGKKMKAGDKAGTFNKDGYVVLSDGNYGKVLGHNVAFYLKNNRWPKKYEAEAFRKEFEKTLNSREAVGFNSDEIFESRQEAYEYMAENSEVKYLIYSDCFYSEEELNLVARDSFQLPAPSAQNSEGVFLYSGEELLSSNITAFTDVLDYALPPDIFYFL
jgi:hypothetical protein